LRRYVRAIGFANVRLQHFRDGRVFRMQSVRFLADSPSATAFCTAVAAPPHEVSPGLDPLSSLAGFDRHW
jgi:hypothetical protein